MTEVPQETVVTIPATNIVDSKLFESDRREVYRDGHTVEDLTELAEVAELSFDGRREGLLETAKLALESVVPEDERPAARQKREALERLRQAAEVSRGGVFYSLVFDQSGSLTDIMRLSRPRLDSHLTYRTKQMADRVGYGPKGNVAFVNPQAVPKSKG